MATANKKTRPSADATRKAIEKAATKLFVKKGFAATSISEIAKTAKINQSLIYHHYENKEHLWRSVKQGIFERFTKAKGLDFDKIINDSSAESFIADIVNYRFEIYDNFPDMRRMLDWQFLENSREALQGVNQRFLGMAIDKIKHFQKQGSLTKEVPAELILTMIFNNPLGYFKSFTNLEKGKSKNQIAAMKKAYVDFSIIGLKTALVNLKTSITSKGR